MVRPWAALAADFAVLSFFKLTDLAEKQTGERAFDYFIKTNEDAATK